MHGRAAILAATLAWFISISIEAAEAKLDILVDKATQRMLVIQDGYIRYMWPVSTGRDNMQTPNGVYTPQRLERNWFSSAYYDSPMPFSIFFHNGYAIHGSYAIDRLGGPASHGCVRLHPHHAAILFDLVQMEGPQRTTIEVTDQGRPVEPVPGREMTALRGVNEALPAPRTIRYRDAGDMADQPPIPPTPLPPRVSRSIVARNGPLPPQRAPGGPGEADAGNGIPRLLRESLNSRSRPRIEAPKVVDAPPRVIEVPRVAEASPPVPAPVASSASGFKLLPASCWSGGASRWQWWSSGRQNQCK